ncbi:MAG: hypothetical protein ABFS38_10905 [Bacteroidota bacterium]
MKKLKYSVAAILLTAILASASAQTGIGARGLFGVEGNSYGGIEISLQKIGKHEWDLGWSNDSWKFTGLKLFNFIGGADGGLGLYGGIGAGIGYSNHYDEFFGSFALDLGSYLWLGPIQVGLDWRPEWNVFNYSGKDVSFNVALSARLMFGKK